MGALWRLSDVLALLAAGQSQEAILKAYPYLEADDITSCLLHAIREENADPDRSQIMQRLRMTPKQRLDLLMDMLAFEERAHRAKRVDESPRADKPTGEKSEHDED